MPVSRRKFLQHGAFAAAALAAAPLPAWSSGHQPAANPDLQHAATSLGHASGTMSFSRQAFEEAVGSAFQVSSGAAKSQAVWLTLTAVNDLPAITPVNAGSMAVPPPPSSSLAITTTGFMLSFQSSAQPLAQGTYAFEHPKLGKFHLFIVPGAEGTQSYTALFNLLSGATASAPSLRHPVGSRHYRYYRIERRPCAQRPNRQRLNQRRTSAGDIGTRPGKTTGNQASGIG
jgi:hypothetical protein